MSNYMYQHTRIPSFLPMPRFLIFTNDDGSNPYMKYAKQYVEHWDEVKKKGMGMLLWGDVGTGKSYMAACIANALLEQEK